MQRTFIEAYIAAVENYWLSKAWKMLNWDKRVRVDGCASFLSTFRRDHFAVLLIVLQLISIMFSLGLMWSLKLL